MSIEKELATIYFDWLYKSLRGITANEADKILAKYEFKILSFAYHLRTLFPIDDVELYRGILLEDRDINNSKFNSLSHIKWISFSSSIEAANEFADPKSFMSSFYMSQHPNAKGYIIKHTPKAEDILFHHSWARKLSLDLVDGLEIETIESQKEVILIQRNHKFELTPFK